MQYTQSIPRKMASARHNSLINGFVENDPQHIFVSLFVNWAFFVLVWDTSSKGTLRRGDEGPNG